MNSDANSDEKGWLQIIFFRDFSAPLTIKEMDAHQIDERTLAFGSV